MFKKTDVVRRVVFNIITSTGKYFSPLQPVKTGILAFAIFFATGCVSDKEIQIEMVNIQLVKVDIIARGDRHEKMLTWKATNNTKFYSFEDIDVNYPVGTSMRVMLRK